MNQGPQNRGTTLPPAEAKKGETRYGGQQSGMPGRAREPGATHPTFSSSFSAARGTSWQPAPASKDLPASHLRGPSARVVDVEVECLVA